MGDEFKVDPASLRATAGQLDEHASEVASHGESLGAKTAGPVGRGAIGEVVETAVKRGLGVVVHDMSRAVRKFYADAAAVLRRTAEETERVDAHNRAQFDGIAQHPHDGHQGGVRAGTVAEPSAGGRDASALLRSADGRVPAAGPGTKRLGTLDAVTRDSNGLIVGVNGQPVDHYLSDLSLERRRAYRAAQEGGSLPRRQQGAAVAVGLDRRTGMVYEGLNGRRGDVIADGQLHPTLGENLQAMHDAAPHRYGDRPHPAAPVSHAEVKAANLLLWDRQAAGLPSGRTALSETTISADFTFMGGGKAAPFCANCHWVLAGVHSVSGRFDRYPPDALVAGDVLR
jgi:excreted virulence factor EspC (type VII ESX diderm)